jgi:hypothetical protein
MSQGLADSLNLELAWGRLKFDRPERCFLSHPFLLPLVELNLPEWLESIRRRLIAGYIPSPCLTVQAPKGHWQVRPGSSLRLDDEIVMNALIGRYLPNIYAELRESQGGPDIAYQLVAGANRRDWVRRGFTVWREFRQKSEQRLRNGARYVLFADISAFYENIDLGRLASDLRRLNFDEESAALVSECLNRWAQPRGKGIPQGYSAADILAKVYLASVDSNLRNEGFDHLRYVDDVRIFCATFQEAQRALLNLTDLLRLRGLNVQSAKTYIMDAHQALTEIDGVGPVISQIHSDLLDEIREEIAGAYGTVADLERLVEQNPDNPPVEVLERAFVQHFLERGSEFDKSLFHFLLTRLGTVQSRIAVDYCLGALSQYPEETGYLTKYFEKIGLFDNEHDRIVEFLSSESALYDYQNYLILKSYFDRGLPYPGIVTKCRAYIRDLTKPHWLRAYAAALVSTAREAADMEFFEAQYLACRDDVERATCICCTAGMELRRRNEFWGRVRRDGNLEERACRWVRAQVAPGDVQMPAPV